MYASLYVSYVQYICVYTKISQINCSVKRDHLNIRQRHLTSVFTCTQLVFYRTHS